MKRFVIATASALILLAGSAAASVPKGPASRLAHDNSFSSSANGGTAVETVAPVGLAPLVPGIDPAVLADPDLAIPGLPGGVTQLFGAIDPALATLAGVVPPAVSGLLPSGTADPAPPVPGVTPAPAPPSEQKKAEPAPAPARKQAKGLTRKAADLRPLATADDIFKGLPANGHAAYGTGSVIHVHALEANGQRLENTDAAFSGATFSSGPIAEIKNEVARIVAPALAAGNAFGRGSGLEVGLGIGKSDPNQIIPGSVAEAKAPPSTGLVTKEVGPVSVPPLLGASLLRGQAQSKANAACTTGTDLSYGLGYASDLGLLTVPGLGSPAVHSAAEGPDRAASQSRSHTFLVPQGGAPSPIRKFGLASETRMTIAPITLFKGVSGQETTLEFAGEWVLRTVADGKTATVHYGPGDVSPSTPLLRILKPGQPVQDILTTQGLLGPNGLTVDVSPLIKVVIGAPPRMIAGDDASKPIQTPTLAAAAVDVVKIQVLANQSGLTAADLRIGHMENATAVPAGGIECPISLVKTSDKNVVGAGDDFTWTVKVNNPNDCFLTKLKVVDTITATPGIIWTVDSAEPKADQMANSGLTWNDIGPLNPGQSKDLKIHVKLSDKTGGGKFLDEVLATGVCGPAAGTAGADAAVGVPVEARVSLNLPEVSTVQAGNLLPRELPRTGGVLAVLPAALALTGGGLILRQTRRRKQR